jgi:hypothetical protein
MDNLCAFLLTILNIVQFGFHSDGRLKMMTNVRNHVRTAMSNQESENPLLSVYRKFAVLLVARFKVAQLMNLIKMFAIDSSNEEKIMIKCGGVTLSYIRNLNRFINEKCKSMDQNDSTVRFLKNYFPYDIDNYNIHDANVATIMKKGIHLDCKHTDMALTTFFEFFVEFMNTK